ncbi:TRAP transporter small permease [Qingshengfaniella alkalisoli]|uniref:TRAP transporter small permease protein n=1 Tax=Qingshengfaniella alkalisoli TaxID=2599296 RepID=A0A5B8J1M9_9RHOB|nr:TRAP transporter small permease subunit [Qingshengfaniella alkalisoli]QDY71081.1 TRAP transporter small permease subunit [Qingshengfaniella alkalisoli]
MTEIIGNKTVLAKVGTVARFCADAVGAALFLSAFTGFIIQIFYRYAMQRPLLWTEEFTMIAFIWAVFWAAAFNVPIREHVSFDVIYDVVSPQARRVFCIVSMLALIAAFFILIPYTWDYLDFLTRKKSSVLRIPMHFVYGCYLLFLLGFSAQAIWRLVKLFGADWRSQI